MIVTGWRDDVRLSSYYISNRELVSRCLDLTEVQRQPRNYWYVKKKRAHDYAAAFKNKCFQTNNKLNKPSTEIIKFSNLFSFW